MAQDNNLSVTNLSPAASAPCFLLNFRDSVILLDCAADLSSLLSFMPCSPIPCAPINSFNNNPASTDFTVRDGKQFINHAPQLNIASLTSAQIASVNAVLVSNYLTLTALPYLIRDSSFRGVILASEATAQFGELLLDELALYGSHVSDHERSLSKQWKCHLLELLTSSHAPNVAGIFSTDNDVGSAIARWQPIFSKHDAAIISSRLHRLSHDEEYALPGSGLKITSVCSGYVIGSSNWVIESAAEKVIYLSGSSALESHVRKINYTKLYEAELMIASQLSHQNNTNIVKSLDTMCNSAVSVLQEGGNVLIPSHSFGIVLDVIERLAYGIEHANLPFCNIYMVSPSAKPSLAMSNIFNEFLHTKRANKAFVPEEPFIHGELQRSGRLFCVSSLTDIPMADFRTPAVVIVSHPSMRLGACVHFMRQWFADRLNVVIGVDADYDLNLALSPYQPMVMRTVQCPLDTRLRPSDLMQIAQNLNSKRVVMHSDYRDILKQHAAPQKMPSTPSSVNTVADGSLSRFTFLKRNENISYTMPPAFEQVIVSGKLLQYSLSSVAQGAFTAGTFRGVMKIRNNNEAHFMRGRDAIDELMAANNRNNNVTTNNDAVMGRNLAGLYDASADVVPESKRTLLSTLNVEQLIKRLAEMGIQDAKIVRGDAVVGKKSSPPSAVIEMPSKGIRIVTNGMQTTCHMKDIKAQRGLRKRLIEAVCSSFDRV